MNPNVLNRAQVNDHLHAPVGAEAPFSRYIVSLRHAPAGPSDPKCAQSSDTNDETFVAIMSVHAPCAAEACNDAIRRFQSDNPFFPMIAVVIR